jgi:hypothetical protein
MSDFKLVKLLDPAVQINTNVTPKGVYSNSTAYSPGDTVSFGNSSYICIQTTVGNAPTNSTYWQLLASANTNKLTTTARNLTGSTIPKGSVVYFSGASGNLPTLALSQANTEMGSTKTIGITATAINDNASGEVIIFGLAENLDTTAFPAGVAVWLSPTVAGGLTTTKPSAPNHIVFIGFVTRSHPTDGTIEVKVQNGFELEELHNVAISSVANGQIIQYESATQLWKNHTLTKSDVGLGNVPNVDATDPANIVQTASYRFVSDTEKATWNASLDEEFESVSKNLKSYPYALNYTGTKLTSIVYTLPSGSITKSFNYTGSQLTSIVLSGSTPTGIDLTKTLTYSGSTLTGVSYA